MGAQPLRATELPRAVEAATPLLGSGGNLLGPADTLRDDSGHWVHRRAYPGDPRAVPRPRQLVTLEGSRQGSARSDPAYSFDAVRARLNAQAGAIVTLQARGETATASGAGHACCQFEP
jgi:hypothetical protein